MFRALIALLAYAGAAVAQVPTVPQQVIQVTTLGWWQDGPSRGEYRLITTREGWEHVWSRIYLEWLPKPSSRDETPPPIKTVEIIPPIPQGTAILEAAAKRVKVGEIAISVIAISNTDLKAKKQRFLFKATTPGVIQLVEPKSNQ